MNLDDYGVNWFYGYKWV